MNAPLCDWASDQAHPRDNAEPGPGVLVFEIARE